MGLTPARSVAAAVSIVAMAVSFLAVAPTGIAAQADGDTDVAAWRVHSARLAAVVTEEDGAASVHIRYELTGTDVGLPEGPVDFGLLEFEGTDVAEVSVSGLDAPVVLWPASGSRRAATFRPATGLGEGDVVALDVRYVVRGAVRGDGAAVTVRIPILTGPQPVASRPGGFEGEVVVPEGWVVSEAFPSGLSRGPDRTYLATLPITPSMVGFRARTDGAWRPGLPLLLDLLTLAILLVFGAYGWRHLRRVAA